MAANSTVIAIEVENRIRHSNETECSLNFISWSLFTNGRVDSAVIRRVGVVVAALVVMRNYNISAFRDPSRRQRDTSFRHRQAMREGIKRSLRGALMEKVQR